MCLCLYIGSQLLADCSEDLVEQLLEPIEKSVTALPMIAALAEEHLPVSDIAVECAYNIVTLRPSIMRRIDSLGLAPSLLALKDRPARTKMQAMLLFELCKHGGFSVPDAVSYCAHFCEQFCKFLDNKVHSYITPHCAGIQLTAEH